MRREEAGNLVGGYYTNPGEGTVAGARIIVLKVIRLSIYFKNKAKRIYKKK